MYKPESILENEMYNIQWDFWKETYNLIHARRQHLVLINQRNRICHLVDFIVSSDNIVKIKECEKIDKFFDFGREVEKHKLCNMSVTVVPIVIRAFKRVPNG